jgi:hypothetical protein
MMIQQFAAKNRVFDGHGHPFVYTGHQSTRTIHCDADLEAVLAHHGRRLG